MFFQVGFGLGGTDQFKIEFCADIDFYIFVNSFLIRVKLNLVTKSGEYRIVKSVLNYSNFGLID